MKWKAILLALAVIGLAASPARSRDFRLESVTVLDEMQYVPQDIRAGDGVAVWNWSPNTGSRNIRAYDFSTGSLLTVHSGSDPVDLPDTSARQVTWVQQTGDPYNWQIMLYDLDSGQLREVTTGAENATAPSIENGILVWEQVHSPSNRDIYIASSPNWIPTPLADDAAVRETDPDISSGRVMYRYDDPAVGATMRVYDLASHQVIAEVAKETPGAGPHNRMAGQVIAMYEYAQGQHYTRAVNYDTGHVWRVDHTAVAVRDDALAYYDEGAQALYLLDFFDDTTSLLRDHVWAVGGGTALAFDDDRLIWSEYIGNDRYQVLSARVVPEPATLGLLAAGVGAVWMGKRRVTR